jgi:protein O-GlcNAc transferase
VGDLVAALQHWQSYLHLKPEDLKARLETGELLAELGRSEQAKDLYSQGTQHLSKDNASEDRLLQAEVSQNPLYFYQVMKLSAGVFPEASRQLAQKLGYFLENRGYLAEARDCYEQTLTQADLPDRLAWELKRDLLVPVFPPERDYQLHYLQQSRECLQTMAGAALPAEAQIQPDLNNLGLYLLNWLPLENMAYTAYNPAQDRRRLGALLHPLLPALPGSARKALRASRRRVGFVLGPSGAVDKFMLGLLRHLPEADLEIHIIHTHAISAHHFSPALFQRNFSYHLLDADLHLAREQILKLELDILYLSEPNANQTMQTFLASFRLAPVQCTSWLSSGSTGQPEMDYFLSSGLLEPPDDPQQFYSESLWLNPTLPTYFYRPERVQKWGRADYGLPETGNLYLCPHLMHKIQPDFESLLADLLRQDPSGHLVLLTHPNLPYLRGLLLARFERNLPELMPRIWFLPYLKVEEYLNLLEIGDVSLDPLYFGGGTTAYEALACGIPTITWPDPERLHGRVTLGCYRKMGFLDCVVDSRQAYIARAIEIASDKSLNARLRREILERAPLLFEDQAAVADLAHFLLTVPVRG